MAVGTGARYLSNIPAQPFVVDPDRFFDLTEPETDTPMTKAWPGFGAPLPIELPHADILAELTISFEGTVAGAAAGIEDPLWAYRLLKEIRFAGPGSTDLQYGSGMDFHALRFLRHPALNKGTEFYSAGPDENGNFRVKWEVPLAADMTTLVGAMWAQSQTQTLSLELRTATAAEIGLTGAPVITGNFKVTRRAFTAPYHPDGVHIVIPDLTRLHSVVAKDTNFNNTGEVPANLDNLQAILMRVLTYVDLGAASGIANPVNYAAISPAVEKITFKYGAKQRPIEWDPAWLLAAKNADDYGAMLPPGYTCLDFVRENPKRDIVVLSSLTDPQILHSIRAGTVLAQNSKVRLVQEVQYTPA